MAMTWPVLGVLAIAACSVTDDRPQTLAYIDQTILAPSCGVAECHSSLHRQSGYVFDTVEAAQQSIEAGNLVDVCMTPPCSDSPGKSYLLTVITNGDVYGNRMPLDQPLPNLDAVLIASWIIDGAPGYTP